MAAQPAAETPPWRVDGFTEVRELGAGAQGRVVLARHAGSGAPVAIKYLARRDGDERAVESLRAEAVMLGRVDDPHVVRLYRFVSAERAVALVMEAVNGVSLKRILAEHGALEPEAALTVLKGSLRGLAAAHAAGVVHRDYKPANVVVRADGLSKLIDFGVAALAGDGGGSGTPAYMAPEQWEKRPASPATDVYAATCVFYECVTGRRPFGGDLAALAGAHLRAPVPVEGVPTALRDLIARGMAKAADDRPSGAADFVAELDAVASSVYGAGWEARGVRAMAGAAVALAAVFPLVAAGLAPAGAAAGTAAGTAAATGTAAGVTAGGGVSAAVAAKAAGAVIAATAVAAGGAGVYAASTGGDAAPADRPRAVQVRPVSFTRTSSGPTTRVTARVPQVSGLPAGLAGRVNALIREPAERWAATAASDLAAFAPRDDPANPYTGKVEYDVGLNGPRLFSVRYTFSGTAMTRNTPAIRVVTVDLTTGRALAARDFLRPDALTQARMSALTRLLGEYGPGHGALCDEGPFWDADGRRYTGKPSDAQDLTPALVNEGVLHMLPTRQGIDFYPPVARMGYSMACGREWRAFHIPYRRLGSFVRPDVFRAAGAAVPTP